MENGLNQSLLTGHNNIATITFKSICLSCLLTRRTASSWTAQWWWAHPGSLTHRREGSCYLMRAWNAISCVCVRTVPSSGSRSSTRTWAARHQTTLVRQLTEEQLYWIETAPLSGEKGYCSYLICGPTNPIGLEQLRTAYIICIFYVWASPLTLSWLLTWVFNPGPGGRGYSFFSSL